MDFPNTIGLSASGICRFPMTIAASVLGKGDFPDTVVLFVSGKRICPNSKATVFFTKTPILIHLGPMDTTSGTGVIAGTVAAISHGISIVPAPALAFNPWLTTISPKTKVIIMRRVKVGLKDVPLPKRIQSGRLVVESLTNNPHFPDAGPWRAMLLAATNELEASYNAAQSSRQITASKISFQHEKAKEFNHIMATVARDVANASNLVPEKVLSAGFNLCGANKAIGVLTVPTGFTVSPSEHSGTMEMYWKTVRGAFTYSIERALDQTGELEWSQVATTSKTRATVNSMTSGQKYWFRVSALGTAGKSPPSVPMAKFAP